jgi:hypothetical protein
LKKLIAIGGRAVPGARLSARVEPRAGIRPGAAISSTLKADRGDSKAAAALGQAARMSRM